MTTKQMRSGAGVLIFVAAFELYTAGVSGPFTALLVYGALGVGIAVFLAGEAMALLEWLRKQADPVADSEPIAPDPIPRPEWMGDPAGNRRRLMLILIAFGVIGGLTIIFVLMR